MANGNVTINFELDSVFVKCVSELIELQNKVLESYRLDINNAEDTFGINLKELGFCEGVFYKEAAEEIAGKLTALKNCKTILKNK